MLFFLAAITLISCAVSKRTFLHTLDEVRQPPGTIKVSYNLFVDQGEISNFNWLEYLYWLKKIYGDNSIEYKNALPDETVWLDLHEKCSNRAEFYLHHPAYRDYPVVGVSFEQVVGYSKWRSDRVMEYGLIREGILDYNISTSKDSIFTIENYFSGQYLNLVPDENVKLYPEYSIPDSITFKKFSVFADSLNTENYKYKKKYQSKSIALACFCLDHYLNEYSSIDNDSILKCRDYTQSSSTFFNRKELVTHLQGNVREMTNIEGVFYGLSFVDPCELDFNTCRVDTNLVNSYTGFRNMCTYKKWESK